MNAAAFNVLESGDAVLHSVQSEIGIAGGILCHGLQYTAGGGEETCAALGRIIYFLLKLNSLGFQPISKLFKGENGINESFIVLGFVFLGYARTNKNRLGIRHSSLDIRAVSLHRRHNICEIFKRRRKMLLNQQIDRMTA